jgi:hypothetical protein
MRMEKFISAAAAVIGVIAVAATVYAVVHFGSVNMSRVDAQAYAWRLEHYGP